MAAQSGEVVVRLPQTLAEQAGGARALTLNVGPAASLGDVLGMLRESTPAVGRRILDETGAIRRFVNVYVGDDECRTLDGLRTPVPPGTVVHVIGSVAGG